MGKNKIQMKDWVTLSDAAHYITDRTKGVTYTDADILQLGFEGKLKLSVLCVNGTDARPCNVLHKNTRNIVKPQKQEMRKVSIGNNQCLEIDRYSLERIEGILDLSMMGSERLTVYCMIQKLLGWPVIGFNCQLGCIVKDKGNLYELCAYPENISPEEEIDPTYCEKIDLPKDYMLVIRSTNLTEYVDLSSSRRTESPKSTNSLLKMIITMAIDAYGYNPDQKKSPIPAEIVENAEKLGLSIDVDTVRNWLKEAANILEQNSLK